MKTDFSDFSNLSNMDAKKARLLEEFMKIADGKNTQELLPLLLAFSNKAKADNIKFTKEETQLLFEQMKQNMSPQDRQKAEVLMNMASVL